MYAIEFNGRSNTILIQATKFEINKEETLIIFKDGIDNVGLFKLSEIQSIAKVTDN